MIAHFSWQWIFLLTLPVPVIALIISYFSLENSPKTSKRPFDFISFLLLAIALSFFLILISGLESGSLNWLALIIFGFALIFFVFRSLKLQTPFLDIRILKQAPVLLGLIRSESEESLFSSINFQI